MGFNVIQYRNGLAAAGFSSILLMSLLTGCGWGKTALTPEQIQDRLTQLEERVTALESKPADATAASAMGSETFPAVSPAAFTDVDDSVPTAAMINDLALLKVFTEIEDKRFKPLEPMTRGQYIIWLYNAYNAEHKPEKGIRMSPAYKVPYSDLAASHPAYKYVQAFGNAGFSVGYDDKTFKPDQPLTREEMIAIKHGVDGGEEYSNSNTEFSDDKQIAARFHSPIYAEQMFKNDGQYGNNIQRAFGPTKTFKPKATVLRYEAAATIWQTDHRGAATANTALGRK